MDMGLIAAVVRSVCISVLVEGWGLSGVVAAVAGFAALGRSCDAS